MAKKETGAQAAFTGLVDESARRLRVGSEQRSETGKQISSKDMRKVADADKGLSVMLDRYALSVAAADKAGSIWQKDLAAATKQWEALLAEHAAIH